MSTNATNNVPTRIRPIGVYSQVDAVLRTGAPAAPTAPVVRPSVPSAPVATMPQAPQAPNVPAAPPLPPTSTKPQAPVQPGAQPTGGGAFRNFFKDVWDGMKDQGKKNAYMAIHPIQSVKRSVNSTAAQAVSPYIDAVRAGHAGYAIGRVLTNAATLAGLFFGGRFLLGRLGALGGGAGVGAGGFFDGVGRVFGSIGRGIASAFRGVGGVAGSVFRGIGSAAGTVFRGIGNVASSVFHGIGNFFRWIIPGGGASVGFR